MNKTLEEFARKTILEGLSQLPEEWQNTFKLMYGRGAKRIPIRNVDEARAIPIESVVKEIPVEKLDWAMQQIENSLKKNKA